MFAPPGGAGSHGRVGCDQLTHRMIDVADSLVLSVPARRAFDRLATDLARVFAGRFVALVAYSPVASVAFASSVTAGDLEALGALAETWHRDHLATPLLLTRDEFLRSVDAFPVEYQAILDRHVLIAGSPPFDGIAVGADDLRRACEVQAKSHLLHLRQGWIEGEGHDADLAEVIAHSAGPLRALLGNVARLHDVASASDGPVNAARLAGLPEDLVRDVLALEAAPEQAFRLVVRLPEYLAAAERLWIFLDRWGLK